MKITTGVLAASMCVMMSRVESTGRLAYGRQDHDRRAGPVARSMDSIVCCAGPDE